MERFTASAHPTVEECERYARDCDIYVGIIAHRYGWIPDGRQVSITELEYDAAKEAERPRLMFEIDGSVPVDMQKDLDPLPDRWDKQKKLDDFKAKYRKDQMPAPFTDTSLGTKVLHALNLWRDQHEGKQPAAGSRKPDMARYPRSFDRYRRAVESLHETLPLAGFKTKLRVPIDLEELYVPLQAHVDLRASGDAVFADAREGEERLKSAHGALDIALIDALRSGQAQAPRSGDPRRSGIG